MKVLNPSSIHGYRRSSEPTIIGNHSCPNSWVSTQYWSSRFSIDGTKVSIGYSIPSIRPSTVVAWGQGYRPQVSLKCLIVNHAILLASSHGVASGRYSVWIRMPCQLEASHRKSGEAAQAKSRTLDARKCQVLVPGVRCAPCA